MVQKWIGKEITIANKLHEPIEPTIVVHKKINLENLGTTTSKIDEGVSRTVAPNSGNYAWIDKKTK